MIINAETRENKPENINTGSLANMAFVFVYETRYTYFSAWRRCFFCCCCFFIPYFNWKRLFNYRRWKKLIWMFVCGWNKGWKHAKHIEISKNNVCFVQNGYLYLLQKIIRVGIITKYPWDTWFWRAMEPTIGQETYGNALKLASCQMLILLSVEPQTMDVELDNVLLSKRPILNNYRY